MRWSTFVLIAFALAVGPVCGAPLRLANEASAQTVDGKLRITQKLRQDRAFETAWSPDGRYLSVQVSFFSDAGYALWDLATGRTLRELKEAYSGGAQAGNPSFLPGGTHVLVQPSRARPAPNGELVSFGLWNVATGAIDGVLAGPGSVGKFDVSADGNFLVALHERDRVVVHDLRTRLRAGRWTGDPGVVSGAAIDPSGRTVALGGAFAREYDGTQRGRVWIHDTATGRVLRTIDGVGLTHPQFIAFLDEARLATTAHQGDLWRNVQTGVMEKVQDTNPIRIWDVATGQLIDALEVPGMARVYAFAASSDGRMLAVATGDTLRVFETSNKREIGRLTGRNTYFTSASFSPDGRRLAVSHTRVRGDAFEILIVDVLP